jgi:hypothetical protein
MAENDVHVEGLGLEGGKAIGNDLESGAHGVEMIEAFLETKVTQIVGTKFIAQVTRELFVLFEKSVLPVGAEDVMAMLDLIENGGQLAAQPLMEPDAEDLMMWLAVRRHKPMSQLRSKILWMGK